MGEWGALAVILLFLFLAALVGGCLAGIRLLLDRRRPPQSAYDPSLNDLGLPSRASRREAGGRSG